MSDPYRLRSYDELPAVDRPRRARGLRRLWLRLLFDPRVRETALVALATLIACLLAASPPDPGAASASASPSLAPETMASAASAAQLSPEDVFWLTR